MSNINRAVTRVRRALGPKRQSIGRAPGKQPKVAVYNKDLRKVREAYLQSESKTFGELKWTPKAWRDKYGDLRGFPWNEPN
jgi:hypothetical protein